MATATMSPTPLGAGEQIKLEYGRPEVFALKYLTGKEVRSNYPDPEGGAMFRAMFSTPEGAKLFLDGEDGADLERGARDLGIRTGELIAVTKIRHARGGGHSIRVERFGPPAPIEPQRAQAPTRTEALLEKSIEMARGKAASAASSPAPASSSVTPIDDQHGDYTPRAPITPAGVKLCGIVCALIDAFAEGAKYAERQGLADPEQLGLTSEDLRAMAISAYIQTARDGGR